MIDASEVKVGTRWRLRWTTGVEEDVEVVEIVNDKHWWGGFGVTTRAVGGEVRATVAVGAFVTAVVERL